ncbi:acyl-CoA dehydrogenase family protein [Mycolicibacter hiberniae]|uniref:Acyl-CoA dehydrogenase n=1 Tax=Mycolicibacter hiberniae TaxID=29314 RepID=A0A7I7WVE6_9MYCO|nr:acyl-CoA dehydrogenase [Mycolicibacter hiberniae]MCV7087090.1 acyl-CoA dehydrogenase family protein [Mycolicibacter hiberniae]ORV67901.1 acyl-CoA dehydrogenase [Mycolicibacter hiberniae]BBZ21609.1 acyl-CoA dehydrogenase [Mycolicibacter hiberniae]
MDLSLSDEQRQLVDSFAALYARESTSERVRAAEPTGFDAALWLALRETGVVEMAVPECDGGWGASVLELALLAEQHGRAIGSAPVIEVQVAAGLLAACGGPGAELLATAMSGQKLITFAPRRSHGSELGMVPAGAVADAVIALVGDRLVASSTAERTVVGNLGALPLADVAIDPHAVTLAEGAQAIALHSSALDRWLTLTAAALVGIGGRAVEVGAQYAQQRKAFGVAIGSFQAVSHPLADSATAVDGARLLAFEAACAFTDETPRVTELSAMAFAFAAESARDATRTSLHVHGGYGFGMEADVQLYYRRARGLTLVYGDPLTALDRVADARYGATG